MRILVKALFFSAAPLVYGALLLAPAPARPAEDGAAALAASPAPAAETSEPTAEPTQPPPSPPPQAPPPPPQAQAPAPQSAPAGQWVYTAQYGWVWMPYGNAYTYAPPSGYGEPYEFVYYPLYGWTWVVAPWVWGWGPWPFFGVFGPSRFAWFGFGWWRTPARFHFAPAFRRGFVSHGGVVTPFRRGGGFGIHGGFVGSGRVFSRGFGGFGGGHVVGRGHFAGGHGGGGGRGFGRR